MRWIDEMLSKTRAGKLAESVKRKTKVVAVAAEGNPIREIGGDARAAWAELLAAMRKDVDEFNKHKARAGHSPVLLTNEALSLERLQFEVYVPEMNSRVLVLTLGEKGLRVDVRPHFPEQLSAIQIEFCPNSRRFSWVVDGGAGKAKNKLTVQQLSEYLLGPILSGTEID